MKKINPYILSGIISVIIIILTGWLASNSNISILSEFCFYFHLFPFIIGFSGGSSLLVILYYFILWIVLSLFIILIIKSYQSAKHKKAILISTISICALAILSVIWIDYSIKKEREERILRNKNEDEKDFKIFKTGDIIFHNSINSDNTISTENYDSIDNKMAIIDVSIHGYSVLEINDRVEHASLRSWIVKNNNYTVKRLKNADSVMTDRNIDIFRNEKQKYSYKLYDYSQCWSDDKIYGSELIWKTYKRALNIELCSLQISSILSESDIEREKCHENYYVSPIEIFTSEKLITVMKK
jgi:uncharacterized protein YycO